MSSQKVLDCPEMGIQETVLIGTSGNTMGLVNEGEFLANLNFL